MTQPRIPPLPRSGRDPRTDELLAALRRPDGSELNIFATLAHHPRLLKRWSAFGGTLLYGGVLPPRDRELLILRTAVHCGAHYEWGPHVGIARDAGVTDDEIERVAHGPDHDGWSAQDAALLRAADELHDQARIGDSTWSTLAGAYDEQQLIEVCMVVGQYHLVAFTLNSLDVEPEPGLPQMPEHAA